MKAPPWPCLSDLKRAYEILQSKDAQVNCSELVRIAPWARVDARLGEILVRYLSTYFRNIDAFALRDANRSQFQPQVIIVLIEFSRLFLQSTEDPRHRDFDLWAQIIAEDIEPAPYQMFFVGSHLLNSEHLVKHAQRSLKIYLRWGFLGDQALISNKYLKPRALTLVNSASRKATLEALLDGRAGEITVSEYIDAFDGQVHLRTAERDLQVCPRLKKIGHTRGRRYQIL